MKTLAILYGLLATSVAIAAPDADLWPYWKTQNADSTKTLSHQAWDDFLKKYVKQDSTGLNRLPYASVSQKDKASLDTYINKLANTAIRQYNREEQRAYWVNLYNALTVKVVIEAMPVESILDIKLSSGFFSKGPWKKKLLTIEGEKVSLDDIEHRILRPIWNDPLTHYSVNCASIGCPNLQNYAFTAENMKKNLTRAAFEFVNTSRGVDFNDDGELIVSSIYKWFKEDFGTTDEKIIEHLSTYAKPDLADRLSKIDEIEDDQYNWKLNIDKRRAQKGKLLPLHTSIVLITR